ncbi:MAG: hypothetical protein PHW46_02710 [Candidatus Omnitrophica bacterium]|nr:hypothetical protein [Candidatus Omnitrophota bacterium]
MYRRYAVKFNKKQVEFVNCVNILERLKRARAFPSGLAHLGVKCYAFSSSDRGKKTYFVVKDCE